MLVYSSEVLNSEDLSSAIYWILSILNNCVFCTVLYTFKIFLMTALRNYLFNFFFVNATSVTVIYLIYLTTFFLTDLAETSSRRQSFKFKKNHITCFQVFQFIKIMIFLYLQNPYTVFHYCITTTLTQSSIITLPPPWHSVPLLHYHHPYTVFHYCITTPLTQCSIIVLPPPLHSVPLLH